MTEDEKNEIEANRSYTHVRDNFLEYMKSDPGKQRIIQLLEHAARFGHVEAIYICTSVDMKYGGFLNYFRMLEYWDLKLGDNPFPLANPRR